MRRRARVDANQSAIVKALRQFGCTVQHLHELGHGCPDLLVGKCGRNFLLEIKDPTKPPNQRKLSDDEQGWHLAWIGQVDVVETAEQAIEIITGENRY